MRVAVLLALSLVSVARWPADAQPGRSPLLGLDVYMPIPDDNALTAEKIALGRRLFHDRRLSRDRSLSCASCHDPRRAFSSSRAQAVGVFDRRGRRNAPALINRGYGRAFFWDGRTSTLEEQVLRPIQDLNEMDLTLDEASARVGLDIETISDALASYVRTILSGDAPYDRFLNGDRTALSREEQDGLRLFRGRARCTTCHIGPSLTDEQFHNTGVAWRNEHLQDEGRAAVTGVARDRGAFKTPTLREVTRTAPYMHDGSFPRLEDVVQFYSEGGRRNPNLDPDIRPLRLTRGEQRALVAFLRSLSGRIEEGVRRP
jgi:cytochrome c peroxidase